ncbi:MAG: hypothetical protein R2724_33155 [Bryobacterales bacterium]
MPTFIWSTLIGLTLGSSSEKSAARRSRYSPDHRLRPGMFRRSIVQVLGSAGLTNGAKSSSER